MKQLSLVSCVATLSLLVAACGSSGGTIFHGNAGSGGSSVGGTSQGSGGSASGSGASGGTNAVGGTGASGGTAASGGTGASGGSDATGGTDASGGSDATGGTDASGGSDATGGTNATGGTESSGGAGGTESTGGSSAGGTSSGSGGDACEGSHPNVEGQRRFCDQGSCYCSNPADTCFLQDTAEECCEGRLRCGDGRGVNCAGEDPIVEGDERGCEPDWCYCGNGEAIDKCLPRDVARLCCPEHIDPVCHD